MSQLLAHNKILENQIASQASSSRQSGMFPSQPENPREQAKAIMLRSGKQLPEAEIKKQDEGEENKQEQEQKPGLIEAKKEEKKDAPLKTPPLPFPQRQQKSKLDKQFEKFMKSFQQLKLNIPLLDVINTMPAYSKFLKDIISHKRKWEDHETIPINEECSAVIQNKLPQKLKDPGSITSPCTIGKEFIGKSLL